MKALHTPIILCALILAGCASHRASSLTPINLVTDDANAQAAQIKLSEAAVSSTKALNQLAAIEEAAHPNAKLPKPANAIRIGMAQRTSIDWNGPIEPLIKKIADASHYRLRVLGTQPAIPVIVSMTVRNQPLADILRDARYQGAKQTTIAVYPAEKVIELRYLMS